MKTVNTSRPQWVTSENHGNVCHSVHYCLVVDLVVGHHLIGVMKVQGPLLYDHQELGEMEDAELVPSQLPFDLLNVLNEWKHSHCHCRIRLVLD